MAYSERIIELIKSGDETNFELAKTIYQNNPEYKSKEIDDLVFSYGCYYDYLKGDVIYTNIINILFDPRRAWVAGIGEYIYNKYNGNLPSFFDYYENKIKGEKVLSPEELDNMYRSMGISFMTSLMYGDALENMFGEPILTDEYGEGFDDDVNFDNKYSYASYFVEINVQTFHIGYDHRGTGIELKVDQHKYKYSLDEIEKVFNSMKKMVDLYKDKN